MDIRNIVRMTFLINKIDMIIIDYIQLIQHSINSKNDNRTAELSTITKYIKALSREWNRPIVVLSQLSQNSFKF